MLCVCFEVVYVCNSMCYVQRVELKLCFVGNCALKKLSIIIIIIIIIIMNMCMRVCPCVCVCVYSMRMCACACLL